MRFQAALPSSADPLHWISLRGDEARLRTPRDDELPRPATTRHTMHHQRFTSGMMLAYRIHQRLQDMTSVSPHSGLKALNSFVVLPSILLSLAT